MALERTPNVVEIPKIYGDGKQPEQSAAPDPRINDWRARIDACKVERRKLVSEWATNIDYRRGKQFESESDQDRIAVTVDWSATKAKQAQLFSQVPQVILTPKAPAFAPAVPLFQQKLNDTLTKARVGIAMDECLPDVINASGIAGVICGYEARTEPAQVPAVDLSALPPEQAQALLASGQVPMKTVPRVIDARFTTQRISPADLLWPVEFAGSDFDDAPWIGRSGRITWAEAKHRFALQDSQKEAVLGDDRGTLDRLTQDPEKRRGDEARLVGFEEIFYWTYRYDPAATSFHAIHHLVFVNGIDTPVIDEPWKGQKFDAQTRRYIGACRFPIRVLTLTYITDDAIPPSDTAIGRPQVNELIRSRSQMIAQRDSSRPMRYYDVNRVDPAIQDALMRGTWQGMIPVQGNGAQAIGEVARAMYPREDFEFDRVAKADLQEAWQIGANQLGQFASGERSASEAGIVQQNFQTRIGYERARVAAFFVGIAEVVGGLLALYGDFELPALSPEEAQRLQTWDRTRIAGEFVYSVRADSTVLLDANQRIDRLMRFLNYTAKSGFVNVEPVITDIAALSGLDPAVVVRKPNPQQPEAPNVSIRLSGTEDLSNPLAVAMLMKSGQAPTPEELEAAKRLLEAAVKPLPPVTEVRLPGAAPGGQPSANLPMLPAAPVGSAHPGWQMMPRLDRRSEDE